MKSLYLAECRILCFVLLFSLFNLLDEEITLKYAFSVVKPPFLLKRTITLYDTVCTAATIQSSFGGKLNV